MYDTENFLQRQKMLSRDFHFKCLCEACRKMYPTMENLPQYENGLPKKIQAAIDKTYTSESFSDKFRLDAMKGAKLSAQFLNRNDHLRPSLDHLNVQLYLTRLMSNANHTIAMDLVFKAK